MDFARSPLIAISLLLLSACGGGGDSGQGSAPPPAPAPLPTASFSATPSTVRPGSTSTLSWSSANATGCAATGGWAGQKGVAGTEVTPALAATSSYSLTCTGAGGGGHDRRGRHGCDTGTCRDPGCVADHGHHGTGHGALLDCDRCNRMRRIRQLDRRSKCHGKRVDRSHCRHRNVPSQLLWSWRDNAGFARGCSIPTSFAASCRAGRIR